MAVNWDAVNEKIATDLADVENILLSEFTTASGQTKKYRSAAEIAQFQTVANNAKAQIDRDANGIMSRVEMDPLT